MQTVSGFLALPSLIISQFPCIMGSWVAGRPHTKTSSSQQHPSITDTWPRPRGLCCAFPSPSTTAGSSRHPGHRTREQGWLRSDPKVLQGSRRFCVWHRTTMPSHNHTSSVNMMCHQHTPRSNRSNRGESARIDAGCRCVCVAAGRVIRPGCAWRGVAAAACPGACPRCPCRARNHQAGLPVATTARAGIVGRSLAS